MRHRIAWGDLVAIEPTAAEVEAAAPALAAAYSDPHNAPLMGHGEPLDRDDVIDHYADLADEGAHPFLLEHGGALAGDGDLRGIDPAHGDAECAILIAARAAQGKGLGTRFAIMLHAFGFRTLGLARVYVAIVPANTGSRRLFEKLGYRLDDSARARAFADDATDLTFSVEREAFERAASKLGETLDAIEITARR